VRMVLDGPPAYAWDWLARQRVAWQEIRRSLLTATGNAAGSATGGAAVGDVPDWSADHLDALTSSPTRGPGTGTGAGPGAASPSPSAPAATAAPPATDATSAGDPPAHDYRALDTRAEVIAALRADYAADDAVRRTVDAVVAEVAFLGRLDVPLHELGVRSAPRGMRWWWCHLGGTGLDDGRDGVGDTDDARPVLSTQLRLVDVLSGYGDALDV